MSEERSGCRAMGVTFPPFSSAAALKRAGPALAVGVSQPGSAGPPRCSGHPGVAVMLAWGDFPSPAGL